MIALGLVLLVLCVLLAVGISLPNTETVSAEAFGVSLSNVSLGGLFLLGLATGALAMVGLGLILAGAARQRSKKRAVKREVSTVRNEQETLAEENTRLQAELEQRHQGYPPTAEPGTGRTVTTDEGDRGLRR
ncbi:MAG: hypothetical protein LH469_13305 [Frankiaceae bacterium]|nr:hypothetical protein [Frankiaceae bacterium]